MSRGWNIAHGLVLVLVALGAVWFFVWLKDKSDEQFELTKDRTYREQATLDIIRMGMHDWMIACAHAQGQDGVAVDTAIKSCRVDLGIGERKWEDRP